MTAAAPLPTVPGLTGLTVLARGGYATVYRAHQESVGREVAVKVENRTLESERDQRRFLREARAAGRMSGHPHVVDLFDAGVTVAGHPYLIMELCEGSYAERMRTAPLNAVEVRDVGFKIADALADAHALGVLHRDVKPANILFSRFGEPALADFGLAILAEWRDVSITLDVLTPAYAPPETFRHATPGPPADVYALCATLYALVYGRPPRWQEDRAPNLVSLVDMFAAPIPDLPGVPPEMMRLLRAGMANDEASRPTALQLRDGLLALRLEPPQGVLIPPLGSPQVHPMFGPASARDGTSGGGSAGGASDGASRGASGGSAEDDTVPQDPPPAGPVSPPGGRPARGPASGGPPPHGPAPRGQASGGPASGGPAMSGSSGRPAAWWLLTARLLTLALLVALAIAYLGGLPAVDASPVRAEGVSASAVASSPGSFACGLPAPPEARCPTVAQCYDSAFGRVDCAVRHTWELFAYGELPAGASVNDQEAVRRLPQVQQVCSAQTLAGIDLNAITWTIHVLVPTADQVRAGERTFRCLAGRGRDALIGPQLKL